MVPLIMAIDFDWTSGFLDRRQYKLALNACTWRSPSAGFVAAARVLNGAGTVTRFITCQQIIKRKVASSYPAFPHTTIL